MSKKNIAVVVGSLRKDSFNRKLAHALIKMAPDGVTMSEVDIGELPLYNQDADEAPVIPAVDTFRKAIKGSDAVLFVSPEYNRSMSGVLKNALDQGSRPWGQSVWGGKPSGVIGVSPGAIGTALAQQHLRNVLAYLDMPTLNQPEAFVQFKDGLFADDGSIGADSQKFIQGWLDAFLQHVDTHSK